MISKKIREKGVCWEKEYENANLWKERPHRYSVLATNQAKEGKVLDIGCGEGNDCIFFASKGYKTTGIDISPSAIKKMLVKAKKKKIKINTKIKDINDLQINNNYNIIVSYGTLQFLGLNFISFLKKLKKKTIIGGVHAFYIFGNNGDFYNIAHHKFYFPSENKIKEIYQDWDILNFETKKVKLLIKGDNGEELYNIMYKILIKK